MAETARGSMGASVGYAATLAGYFSVSVRIHLGPLPPLGARAEGEGSGHGGDGLDQRRGELEVVLHGRDGRGRGAHEGQADPGVERGREEMKGAGEVRLQVRWRQRRRLPGRDLHPLETCSVRAPSRPGFGVRGRPRYDAPWARFLSLPLALENFLAAPARRRHYDESGRNLRIEEAPNRRTRRDSVAHAQQPVQQGG
jgi:hypothetical protein